jgi:hypothetical protein
MIESETQASSLPKMNKRWRAKASVEEKQSHYAQWQQSGLTKTEFCEQQGISKSALYRWIKELEQTPLTQSLPMLVPVRLTPAEISCDGEASLPSAPATTLDIWLPNGIHLRASLGNALTALTPFIREISDVNPTNTVS